MTQYEKAAIIGYWRQGNSYEKIAELSGVHIFKVINIIKSYAKGG